MRRVMSVADICQWLHDTSIGTSIRESLWSFPILDAIHVLGLGLSIGTIVWFDLRLLGLKMTDRSVSELWRQLMPYAVAGFVVMFVSGSLLFWSEAVRAWNSIFFKIKLVALLLAGLNALIFQLTVYRSLALWDKQPVPPIQARIAGLLSLVLWGTIIAAGRTMAYTF
jgi:hypothetical protein